MTITIKASSAQRTTLALGTTGYVLVDAKPGYYTYADRFNNTVLVVTK